MENIANDDLSGRPALWCTEPRLWRL